MGYSYGWSGSGRMALACDQCGNVGGVRKRTCPYTVLTDSHRSSNGQRHTLSYCYPPALCSPCYKALGGLRGIHDADCAAGAAAAQVQYDATQALLDAGEYLVAAAYGSWDDRVPEGMTGVLFTNGSGDEKWLLVPKDEYHPGTKQAMSLYLGKEVITMA